MLLLFETSGVWVMSRTEEGAQMAGGGNNSRGTADRYQQTRGSPETGGRLAEGGCFQFPSLSSSVLNGLALCELMSELPRHISLSVQCILFRVYCFASVGLSVPRHLCLRIIRGNFDIEGGRE